MTHQITLHRPSVGDHDTLRANSETKVMKLLRDHCQESWSDALHGPQPTEKDIIERYFEGEDKLSDGEFYTLDF